MPLAPPIRFQRAADQRLWDGTASKFREACLTCPVFVTGPEFLPELREQHTRTLTLIDNAKGCGHTRIAEMNQQVADNLDRMIGQMDENPREGEEAADAS
ncbi:hypothetical protein [Streptomyces sp. NPDC051572]|uniref:hypothetical protein n=1 Tax=Streptomyces sp. NPDC051572 TaxID=3155802 RepID=UPI00344B6DA4